MDSGLPKHVMELEDTGVSFILREDIAESVRDAWLRGNALEAGPSDMKGRGEVFVLDAGGISCVVRQYRRGGLLASVFGARGIPLRRAIEELRVALAAHEGNVPTPRPVGIIFDRRGARKRGLFWLSELLADAGDLASTILSGGLTGQRRAQIAHSVARAVAQMHDAGFVHADLQLRNILIRPLFDGTMGAYIIDWDRAERLGRVTQRAAVRNLIRLDRSLRKWPAIRSCVTQRDRLRFLRAYVRTRREGNLSFRELASQRPRHLWHRLGWRLFPPDEEPPG